MTDTAAALALPVWTGRADDPTRVRADVDAWASSDSLVRLVSSFGGDVFGFRGEALLDRLDAFAAEHWDFRGGRERNAGNYIGLTSARTEIVLGNAQALGLADRERPAHDRYDVILMTGGMIRAGIVKPRFVRELVDSGLAVDHIVFLGAFRPFSGDEMGLASQLGVRGDNEVDAMVAGMESAFGPLGNPEVDGVDGVTPFASWRELSWTTAGMRLSVIAAPSSVPESRRANSADTYRFWAEHRRSETERSVLQVTSPIYVPYQAASAVEVLGVGRGLAVETVGTSATSADLGDFSQVFGATHHLQELRAAIGSMRSLRRALESSRVE